MKRKACGGQANRPIPQEFCVQKKLESAGDLVEEDDETKRTAVT